MKYTIFRQFLKPITQKLLDECTRRFQSDYHYETCSTKKHLEVMIYAHLQEIKSLRTLEVALNSQAMGRQTKIHRSTLSDANRRRSSDCFFWLLEQVMSFLPQRQSAEIKKVVKLLDSSPIPLRGSGYDEWAKQYATHHWQGLKLHLEYDVGLKSPTRTAISYANYNDCSMAQNWFILPDTIYVFDKGYCDFNWWWSIHQKGSYFVTRLKKNTAVMMETHQAVEDEAIVEEGVFHFKNQSGRGGKRNLYRESVRRISVKREGKNPLILVTNLMDVSAKKIAALYKARWEIELFFKWIKQNLKLKRFFGRSANAVKIQIATALIAYLLVQIFKRASKNTHSLQWVLTWLKFNLHIVKIQVRKNSPPLYPLF